MREGYSPSPGDVVAQRYRIGALVGRGGTAAVYAATDVVSGERVALKMLAPRPADEDDPVVRRFRREARLVATLSSPHAVRVYDAQTTDTDELYIAQELLDGVDLAELLRRTGPLPVRRAVDYVLEAGEALAEAHALGILHRDLKPANLFLAHDADGRTRIKVIDFGVAKLRPRDPNARGSALTHLGSLLGSPEYMSPEQIQTPGEVDERADVYSLAVTLYELLSDAYPYEAKGPVQSLLSILRDPPIPLGERVPSLPAGLTATIMRGIAKSPDDRPTLGEFLAAIEAYSTRCSATMVAARLQPDDCDVPERETLRMMPVSGTQVLRDSMPTLLMIPALATAPAPQPRSAPVLAPVPAPRPPACRNQRGWVLAAASLVALATFAMTLHYAF
jgi:serine/threonine-protein kinase